MIDVPSRLPTTKRMASRLSFAAQQDKEHVPIGTNGNYGRRNGTDLFRIHRHRRNRKLHLYDAILNQANFALIL